MLKVSAILTSELGYEVISFNPKMTTHPKNNRHLTTTIAKNVRSKTLKQVSILPLTDKFCKRHSIPAKVRQCAQSFLQYWHDTKSHEIKNLSENKNKSYSTNSLTRNTLLNKFLKTRSKDNKRMLNLDLSASIKWIISHENCTKYCTWVNSKGTM